MRSRATMPPALLLLLHALLLLHHPRPGRAVDGVYDEDEDEDEDLLTVGDRIEEPDRLQDLQEAGGVEPEAQEVEDPMANIIQTALTAPAIFAQRLKVTFEGGVVEELDLQRGDVPNEVVAAFAAEHNMEEGQAQLTARALARAQLEGAYAAESTRRTEGETLLQKPALFNLSLAVRESDETDDTQPVTIVAGQTPEEAAAEFASEFPITTEVERKIAERLLEDQRNVAWDVATEQFAPGTTVVDYLAKRLVALNRAELTRLKDMIESRVSQLLLFKLYVECDGCGGEDGPLVLAAHEGDNVEDIVLSVAEPLGRNDDEEWVGRVRGALMVSFHTYKAYRDQMAEDGVTFDDPEQPNGEPKEYWYDERSDSFKDPRAWEDAPPRSRPLFQVGYEVNLADGDKDPVNVTIYESDVAIEVGEALATNYGAEAAAGWDFAHYVATSFRKVSDKLNLTVGKRPWEDEAPGGMPLFRVDLAEIEGLEEEGSVVVHEGDGPKGLARAALKYHREKRDEDCVPDGSGKAGGLLYGAAVGEAHDGVCAPESPEVTRTKVGLLSAVITEKFTKYFG